MTNSSESIIFEILKLYDTVDKNMTQDPAHQCNGFESVFADVELPCSNCHMKERHQSLKLPDNAKECRIECFQQLHSHLKLLFKRSEYTMGYERAFATLTGQDVETFPVKMTLYLDQLQQQLVTPPKYRSGRLCH